MEIAEEIGRILLTGVHPESHEDISEFPSQKRAIFRKIKDNSAQQRNWTALTLPVRANPQDCG
jgi:hypothetical protein